MIRPLLSLVLLWATLVATCHIGFFLFSCWWGWHVTRAGIEPAIAMRRLRAHPAYRAFFALSLALMAPIYVPVQLRNFWRWRRDLHRKLATLSKQPPSGTIEHHHLRGGLMVYADLTLLSQEEQEHFKARLDAGEHPELVFADIEQRLQVNQGESR